MNQKFSTEKPHLEQLLNLMSEKKFKITPPMIDPPDLCLKLNKKKIGVEHTRLFTNSLKGHEIEIQKLLTDCRVSMARNISTDIMIRIKPNYKIPLTKKRRLLITPLLVEEVLSKIHTIQDRKSKILENPFPEILHVAGYKRPGILKWTTDSSIRFTGELKDDEIIRPISKKAQIISKIKSHDFDSFWLLVVVEGMTYSDCAGYKNNGISIDGLNPFEKVFLLHEDDNWYEEIKINCV